MFNNRKEFRKNFIMITIILLLATIPTYYIYNKFQVERNLDYSSESLEISFHGKLGDKINITKVIPVTDSVGLASNSYTFTIKNNLTEKVNYKIKLEDNNDLIKEDNCGEYKIDKESIRVSIKEDNEENKVYTLKDLEEQIIEIDSIGALKEKNYTIRAWVERDTYHPAGSNLHYHSLIKIIEE